MSRENLHELIRSMKQIQEELSGDSSYPLSSKASTRLGTASILSGATQTESIRHGSDDGDEGNPSPLDIKLSEPILQPAVPHTTPPSSPQAKRNLFSWRRTSTPTSKVKPEILGRVINVPVKGLKAMDPKFTESSWSPEYLDLGPGNIRFSFHSDPPSIPQIFVAFCPQAAPDCISNFERKLCDPATLSPF
jgi:hypothetical protein